MRKKRMSIVLVILAVCLLATACSSKNDPAPAAKEDEVVAKEDKAIALKILIPGYESGYLKEQMDKIIKDFENENPNITVEVLPVGWDELNSKIVQLYQAGEAPDIMLTGTRSIRQFSEMGVLEPLDEYITEEFREQRVENVLETAKIKGVQYGIPMGFSSRALYYRTDLIETPPTNWDELFDIASEVTAKNPDVYGFAIPTDITHGADELLNFIYQNGGRVIDDEGNYTLNTPENIETFEYIAKFGKAGIIPDPVGTSRSDLPQLFQNGNVAMFISLPSPKETLDSTKEKYPYATALLPAGSTMGETLVTDSYTISAISKNKQAAWDFVEFAGKFEYQNDIDSSSWFPILKAEEKEERYHTEFSRPFAEMIQYGVPEPHVKNWDLFNEVFTEAAQKVLTGQATAEEALNAAQKELEE